jgi:hypothetical protein
MCLLFIVLLKKKVKSDKGSLKSCFILGFVIYVLFDKIAWPIPREHVKGIIKASRSPNWGFMGALDPNPNGNLFGSWMSGDLYGSSWL